MVQQESPFIASTITLCFLFSTMYGLAALYFIGQGMQLGQSSEIDTFLHDAPSSSNPHVSSILFDFIVAITDFVLEIVSILSPIGQIKVFLVLTGINSGTPEIYTILNLFVLRPIGWAMFLLETNYILNKIPTVSGGG
jgi:hypothetical protein